MNNNNNTINTNNKRRYNNHHNGNNVNNAVNNKNRNRQRFQPERPSINKVYDSNGPSGRQRGNASTLYEKYSTLARDASSSGDRVLSENFMQYAEHYLRIVNSIQEQMQSMYREEYREAQLQNEEQSNNIQQNSSLHHDKTSETEDNFSKEEPVLTPQKSEHIPDDAMRDKPVIRRKSYPFARRKPYDPLQVRQHNHEARTELSLSETSDNKITHDVDLTTNKIENNVARPEVLTEITESDDNIKRRRVVRKRPITKDIINSEAPDTKNPSD